MTDPHIIRDPAALEALYGAVNEASALKEIGYLHPHYAAFIKASPFAVLATAGPHGLDASPRGDAPGFVEIVDDKTLLLADRRGNNRIDSLRNVLHDPRVGLLFLVPGIGETLRVNGRAEITVDPALLARFAVGDKPPRSLLRIHIESVFFQCSRAVIRSELWNPERRLPRSALPSTGQILAAVTHDRIDAETYDRELPPRLKATLY
ncbi:MAG: flavin-nucleotide-binding protein [Devosia sp. 67-54]|uniref:pyridoxamine 5'-phosphate oxidase family protein n=1 Tax=unclassified Devosia TaxID=196773 RepID=UPI00095E642C|nr:MULTISPECIES: pyridoxamine 5'-phosphate oxidase family protein [unclassified Devosia]OJX18940.1 MAG: flavin-nucleotide-binding protein [Devosia sp. 67-54]